MKTPIRPIVISGAAALLAVLGAGCTRHAKEARLLTRAGRDFAAGNTAAAEIEYLNVARLDPTNAEAIGRLGIIYFDQGLVGKSLPCLIEAKRLQPGNRDVRLRLGLYDVALGGFKDAAGEANFLLGKNPADGDAALLLAQAAVRPADIDAARLRLQALPGSASASAPVLVALATLDFRERRFDAAAAGLERALALDPKSSDAYTALGALDWEKNQVPQADEAFARAAALAPARSAKRLQYAEFKIQRGDQAGARRLLDETMHDTPGFLPAELLLAKLDETEKNYAGSDALAAKVLDRDPAQPEALLLMGRLKLAEGKPQDSLLVLGRAEKIYPRHPRVEYELAEAYLATGATEKAVASLNRAVAQDPDFTEAVIFLARIEVQTGDPGSATVLLNPFVSRHPGVTAARFLLAGAAVAQGNLDDALGMYQQLQRDLPRDPQPVLFQGIILRRRGKDDEARRDFVAALKLDPDNLPALIQLVDLDIQEGLFADALGRIQGRIAKQSGLPEPYLLRARIQLAQRDWSAAETSLAKAAALDPASDSAPFMLAQMDVFIGRRDQALATLRRIVAKHPGDIAALMLIATTEEARSNYPAAQDAYEKVLATDAGSSAALNNLAYLDAVNLGQLDRALELAQRARKLLPHDPRVADTLGWIAYLRQQYPWALTLLQESADALPSDPEIEFHLGMTHYMQGDEASARTALRRALHLGGTFPDRPQAVRRLAVLEVDPASARPDDRARLEAAAAENPADPVAASRLAALAERGGDPARAVAIWEAALRANPASEAPALQLARLYAVQGDTARAFTFAKSARDLAPDDPEAAHLLGWVAYRLHHNTWAVSLLAEAADKRPDDPAVLYDLANADYAVGRVADAATAMRAALQADPRFGHAAEARSFLEWLGVAAHPSAANRGAVNAALQRDPSSLPLLMAAAAIARENGRPLDARQDDGKAIALDPDFSPALRDFVILCAANPGQDRRALELAPKAREFFPDDRELADACRLIAARSGVRKPYASVALPYTSARPSPAAAKN